MMTRLHSKYPELARMIVNASRDKARLVVRTAARLAVDNAGLEGDLGRAALAAVDGRERLQSETRAQLEELQRQWDDRYLAVQDSLEADQEFPADALVLFHRARALAAVLGALEAANGVAAANIVYETIASTSDELKIVSAILEVAA